MELHIQIIFTPPTVGAKLQFIYASGLVWVFLFVLLLTPSYIYTSYPAYANTVFKGILK